VRLWRRRRPPTIGLTESYIIAELCHWLVADGKRLGDVSLVYLRHSGRGLMRLLEQGTV
jgi:hypothetical protein